jgi:hypothetical protein
MHWHGVIREKWLLLSPNPLMYALPAISHNFFCKFNHKSDVVSKARDKRNAISGVTEARPFEIFDRVFLETPRIEATQSLLLSVFYKL